MVLILQAKMALEAALRDIGSVQTTSASGIV
jgi:hypothetical protein